MYLPLATQLADLFRRIAANDYELEHINARALPRGVGPLRSVELVARGLDGWVKSRSMRRGSRRGFAFRRSNTTFTIHFCGRRRHNSHRGFASESGRWSARRASTPKQSFRCYPVTGHVGDLAEHARRIQNGHLARFRRSPVGIF